MDVLIIFMRKFNKSAGFWLVAVNFELLPGEADRISVECEEGRGKRGGFLGRGNTDPLNLSARDVLGIGAGSGEDHSN